MGTPEGGFEALYRREYVPMFRVAHLLLDSADAAEVATHDAFAKVSTAPTVERS